MLFDYPYNVLQNNGKAAHQEVPHCHFHLIPKRGDGLGLVWKSKEMDMKVLEEYANAMYERLKSESE